jgi:hypothetical protein
MPGVPASISALYNVFIGNTLAEIAPGYYVLGIALEFRKQAHRDGNACCIGQANAQSLAAYLLT